MFGENVHCSEEGLSQIKKNPFSLHDQEQVILTFVQSLRNVNLVSPSAQVVETYIQHVHQSERLPIWKTNNRTDFVLRFDGIKVRDLYIG